MTAAVSGAPRPAAKAGSRPGAAKPAPAGGARGTGAPGAGGMRPADRLGNYPTKFDISSLGDRRAWWTARLFAMIAGVSILLNIALTWGIVGLTPLKTVQPMLVTFAEKSGQVVKIEPMQTGTKAADLVAQSLAREYVLYRASVVRDENEQLRRWGQKGYVGRRTTPEEFNRFVGGAAKVAFDEMRANNITREAIIITSNKISDGYYTVDYDTIDRGPDEREITRQSWTASLTVAFLETSVTFEDMYVNPNGFTVLSYTVSQRSVPARTQ